MELHILRKTGFRKLKPFDVLLLNLSISDLLVGVFLLLKQITKIILSETSTSTMLDKMFGYTGFGMIVFSYTLSLLNVLSITIDRFILVSNIPQSTEPGQHHIK